MKETIERLANSYVAGRKIEENTRELLENIREELLLRGRANLAIVRKEMDESEDVDDYSSMLDLIIQDRWGNTPDCIGRELIDRLTISGVAGVLEDSVIYDVEACLDNVDWEGQLRIPFDQFRDVPDSDLAEFATKAQKPSTFFLEF